MVIRLAKNPYKPSFNVQAYNVIDRVDLSIRETHPNREVVDQYSENAYYGGITFVFDNIGKVIYTYVTRYLKKRDWAKKIDKEKNPINLKKLVLNILESQLDRVIEGYDVKRVEEGEIDNDFETLFLYEIQDYSLYQQHYFRSDVEMLLPQPDPVVEERVAKCPKCGWILSKGKNKCPRCQTIVGTEPEPKTPESSTEPELPPPSDEQGDTDEILPPEE
jgi:hypothetical protein